MAAGGHVAADEQIELFEDGEGEGHDGPNDGRLRPAMLDDGQPWLPWWLPIPGVALSALWAAYQAVSAPEPGLAAFLTAMLWPGAPIFVLTTITSYFGWRLDLD